MYFPLFCNFTKSWLYYGKLEFYLITPVTSHPLTMWPFHRESNLKVILKTIAACCLVVIVAWGVYYFFIRSNASPSSQTVVANQPVITSSPEEIKTGYAKTLSDLKRSLENDNLSNAEARDKADQILFATKVPKEMLDKHLEVVLKVRQQKNDVSTKDLITLVEYLLQQI